LSLDVTASTAMLGLDTTEANFMLLFL
jgi:hypothetical protein